MATKHENLKNDCVELITRQSNSTHTISANKEKTKKFFKIGCWNVRSLGNPTKFNLKIHNVIAPMKENNVAAMALSEVQWPGYGVLEVEGVTVVYPGTNEKLL